MQKCVKILIGLTGSVASIKYLELIKQIQEKIGQLVEIKIIPTFRAIHFIDINALPLDVGVVTDDQEWNSWQKRGDPVLHIELRKWADYFIIAPLSANTLAKIVNGICDNLLTCVFRAWDFSVREQDGKQMLNKPILVAPAMNTYMYQNPITAKQLQKLAKLNVIIAYPIEKTLICGDKGIGAMQEPSVIGQILSQIIKQHEKQTQ